MTTPTLEMSNIGKRYPGVVALDGVSLELHPGEIVALIGENGAGKSTLMKILGGVVQPDNGTIKLDGSIAKIGSVAEAIKHRISFIHQELNVLDNLDVGSNIFLGREPLMGGPLRLVDRAAVRRNAEIYLQRVGLNVPANTNLGKLSIAQQQLVEIAKALSLDARILIMDEPTSSLTLAETDRLLEVAMELRAAGVSIVYISHRLNEVRRIADRVVALRDGKPAGALSHDEITHDAMVRMMVGRDVQQFYPSGEASAVSDGLAVENLRTQRFPKIPLNFKVNCGEILGFSGLIGAGRSEVAQAIFGVDPPVSGNFAWAGKPIKVKNAREAIKQGIYLAPEDRRLSGLIVQMPIRENITLPALDRYKTAGLINRRKEDRVASKLSARLRVKAPGPSTVVSTLSGGNQQKVVLAKWLSLEPRMLIFDEPTRGIDVGAKSEIYDLMRTLANEGVAVMMISSDMEEVLGVSDRIAVMHEGRITGTLEREQFSEEAIMQLAVGGSH